MKRGRKEGRGVAGGGGRGKVKGGNRWRRGG